MPKAKHGTLSAVMKERLKPGSPSFSGGCRCRIIGGLSRQADLPALQRMPQRHDGGYAPLNGAPAMSSCRVATVQNPRVARL